MKTVLTLTGSKSALETFKGYFEGPPRIEAVAIEGSNDSLTVTVHERDAEFIKYAAKKFGCTAEIE